MEDNKKDLRKEEIWNNAKERFYGKNDDVELSINGNHGTIMFSYPHDSGYTIHTVGYDVTKTTLPMWVKDKISKTLKKYGKV